MIDAPPLDPLVEIDRLAAESVVDPSDRITAGKIASFLDLITPLEGAARQAGLEALRPLVGQLGTDERQSLNLYDLFRPPDQNGQIERFLASCPRPPGTPTFQAFGLDELLNRPPKPWLVDNLFGRGDLGQAFGPPASGKTHALIDFAFAACLGRQWALRFDVARPLTVAYAAGEGLGGLPARFASAAARWEAESLPNFTFFELVPQLFAAPESTAGIAAFVREWQDRQARGRCGALDLLIVDTQHSATVGADENSATDMGQVLEHAKRAILDLGCAVLLVHHSNKAGTGERGSSAMRGAMDFMISFKPTAGKFLMTCEKLKDGAAWKSQTFSLVELGDSVRVWWDEPRDVESGRAEKAEQLLDELRQRPGVKFTAKSLAEATGGTPSATTNALNRLVDKGSVQRGLEDEGKPPSSRNPWVYCLAVQEDASSFTRE